MEIKFYGANCVRIQAKKAGVVIDDNLDKFGLKPVTKPADLALFTSRSDHGSRPESEFFVDVPGEYEVLDVSIKGIAARAHVDEPGQKNAVIYRLIIDDIKVGVLGHIYPDLSDEQLESLGMVDVLIIPVGGHGFTLDAIGALKLIKKISPSVVIPTHYSDAKIKYEIPQADLETARKELSLEPAEEEESLKIKGREFGEGTKLVILSRQQQ